MRPAIEERGLRELLSSFADETRADERAKVVAEIVAELRELALSFNAEDCADHIETKFGGNNGDR